MKTASVELANGDSFDSVSVLATDEPRDLAVVKIAGFNLSVLDLGNSDALNVGEPVVIVGSPRGLEGTVTAGILSSVRDSGEGFKVLQTDAAVNPGNSGGPLVNSKGQVIGVVSFKLRSAEGLNFAVPINYVRGLLNNLHEPIGLDQLRRSLIGTASVDQENSSTTPKEPPNWTTERMLTACKDVIEAKSDWQGNEVFPLNFDTGQCWGTFTLLWSFGSTIGVGTGQEFVPDLCLPKGTTVAQVIAIFGAYAHKHHELYDRNAFFVALDAMSEAFPCKVRLSLKETLYWLKENIPLGTVNYMVNSKRGVPVSWTEHATVFGLDSCTGMFDVVYTTTWQDRPKDRNVSTVRYTVPLGALTEAFVQHMENQDSVDSEFRILHKPYVGGQQWGYRVYLRSKPNHIIVADSDESLSQRPQIRFI
jgi:hypothetical protein